VKHEGGFGTHARGLPQGAARGGSIDSLGIMEETDNVKKMMCPGYHEYTGKAVFPY
jgi:hypothetical protein